MVTTFSARLLSLNNLYNNINPVVSSTKRKHCVIEQQPSINIKQPSSSMNMKRQSYYDAACNSNSNKRRRQKEELQFAAATIRTALSDAGRPPLNAERREKALPMSTACDVDRDSCRVMTSKEFDEMEMMEMNGGSVSQSSKKDEDEAQDVSNSNASDISNNNEYDLSSMYMVSGLIQSTRQFYSISSYNNDNSDNNNANTISTSSPITTNNIKTLNEDNSTEGLSSWTPSNSSSENLLNDNDKKNIDNDNQSDAQSTGSYCISGSYGIGGGFSPRLTSMSMKAGEERREGLSSLDHRPFSVIG